MTFLSDVLRVKDSIATVWRKLNVPMAFPLGNGPGAGLSLFICSAAGWTWGFAGAVVCDLATAHQRASSSQDCPLLLHMESAFEGSEASL